MLKRELTDIISRIAVDNKLSMDIVERVLKSYIDILDDSTPITEDIYPDIQYGVMGVDSIIKCSHGLTLIHGSESSGKTSFLKSCALSSSVLERNTLYHDPENKLFLKQIENIGGILFSNSSSIVPIKDWLHTRLLDVILVDSFTAMVTNSQNLMMHQLRKSVPYIIGSTQMRWGMSEYKHVPACTDIVLNTSHTRIMITGGETISFGSIDMKRIYFIIVKHANPEIVNTRGNIIIYNNIACNFHHSMDILRNKGRLTNAGNVRLLDNEKIGTYEEIMVDKSLYSLIIRTAAEEYNVSEHADHYIAMYEMFHSRDKREETTRGIISEETKSRIPV